MQIVIDIPEEVYKAYKMDSSLTFLNVERRVIAESYLVNGLINGTPLPKGHGRLIDVDDYLINGREGKVPKAVWEDTLFYKELTNRPTIIEADKTGD